MEPQIVVIESGWVFQSNRICEENGSFTLFDARCIRKWGTNAGLGELRSGPTKDTVLDLYGTVSVPKEKVLFFVSCDFWNL